MGILESEIGRAPAAIEIMRRALTGTNRSPAELAQGYANLATILFSLRRLDEAADAAREALSLAPTHAAAHNTLGNILGLQGKLDEAMKAYQRAIGSVTPV